MVAKYSLKFDKRLSSVLVKRDITLLAWYGVLLQTATLQEANFHWNLNFSSGKMANSLNFVSANYKILKNLSMMAYIIVIQKSIFAYIKFREFDHSGQGC